MIPTPRKGDFAYPVVSGLVAAANAGGRPGFRTFGRRRYENRVWAVNATGADLRLGDAAAIDLDDATPRDDAPLDMIEDGIEIRLRTPEEGDSGNFVICADEIPDGEGGFVYVAGIVLARISVGGSESGDYADIEADSSVLVLAGAGAARVLWLGGDSPEAWALVRFPVSSIGTADNPYELPEGAAGSDGESEASDESWSIDEQPDDYDGVKWTAFRLYWSGDSGDPVYQFVRQPTYDSAGRLVAVSAETRSEAFGTGSCEA